MKKKKFWIISGSVLLLIIVVSLVFSNQKPKVEYSTVFAKESQLLQTVSESGTVKPIKELSLNFLSSGRLKEIRVKTGDKVEAGQILASLEDTSLQMRKTEAEAALSVAEASLSKLVAGASKTTINVSLRSLNQAQTAVSSAKVDLEQIKKTAAENIKQAEKTLFDLESKLASDITPQEQAVSLASTAYDNTKKNGLKNIENARSSALLVLSDKIIAAQIALDNIKTILEDESAKDVLGAMDSTIIVKTKNSRLLALDLFAPAEEKVSQAKKSSDEESVIAASQAVKELLLASDRTLNQAYSLLEASIVSYKFTQAKLDSFKTIASSQISQVNAALNSLENSIQGLHNSILSHETSLASANDNLNQAKVNLENAKISARNALNTIKLNGDQQVSAAQARLDNALNNLALSQAQYDNTVAPARLQDLAVSEAQVRQSQAALDGINQQIQDTLLVSPVDGVANQVNYEVGEQFGLGGQAMLSLLVDNSFNIEVDISESNISKIKVGDETEITLDAFPEDLILKGRVSFIEPAQTVIQDVVYYKVKIEFSDLENIIETLTARNLFIKSGMTANVVIMTEKLDKVVNVPARAVIEKDGQKIIRILSAGKMIEKPVSVGLQGDEGYLEIKDGLAAGEEVITFIRNGDK